MLNLSVKSKFDEYFLTELFDSSYPIKEIIGISISNKQIKFKNINQLFSYHLKNKNKNPILYIKCYFTNNNNDDIELLIHPITAGGNIFEEDIKETYTIIFNVKNDIYKMKTDSFDANIITGTIMKTLLEFLNVLKKIVNLTTNDWNLRTDNGILRFDPYPNMTMNPVSKQIRNLKEKEAGKTQRGHMYEIAFNKIIKPIFSELNIESKNTYYLIKS